MKRKFTAPTRPAHRVRGAQLHQAVSDDDAHRVGSTHHHERGQRERQVARQGEDERPEAEDHHRLQHPHPHPAGDAAAGEHRRHRERPDGRRRAQDAEAPRPGMEDVGGIDRHQRRRSPEQHREHVERDRPEDRPVAPDEADAGEEVADPRLRPVAGRRLQPYRAVEDAADQPEAGHDRIGQRRPDGIGEAAERRPRDHRHLEHAGRERRRPLELPLRRHPGQQRRRRRRLEGGGDAEERDRGIDRRHRQPALPAPPAEEPGGGRLGELADLHHPLAVVAVGGMAGDEDEERHRHELRQPHQPELEGAAGHRIDLPAERHGRHLRREAREAAPDEVEQERRVGEEPRRGDLTHRRTAPRRRAAR